MRKVFTHVLLPLLAEVLRDTLRLCVIQNYVLIFIDTTLSPFHIQRYNMREASCHLLSFSIAKMYENVCLTNRSTVC